MKKILACLAILSVIVIGTGYYFWLNLENYLWPPLIPPASYWVDMDEPLREQTSRVEVAGVLMEIPTMYFDTRLDPGVKQDAILLEVVWPDMKSTLELKDRAEYLKVWRQERRGGWILLEPAERKTPLNSMVENRREKDQYKDIPSAYDLKAFLHYKGKSGIFQLWSEVYFSRDNTGRVTTLIECLVNGPVPVCSQRFMRDSLYYDISYNKAAFLKDWRAQQQRAIDFIDSFKIPK